MSVQLQGEYLLSQGGVSIGGVMPAWVGLVTVCENLGIDTVVMI